MKYVRQTIMLLNAIITLNLYSALCHFYLNETGRKIYLNERETFWKRGQRSQNNEK